MCIIPALSEYNNMCTITIQWNIKAAFEGEVCFTL
jgi:hypothetical protein